MTFPCMRFNEEVPESGALVCWEFDRSERFGSVEEARLTLLSRGFELSEPETRPPFFCDFDNRTYTKVKNWRIRRLGASSES